MSRIKKPGGFPYVAVQPDFVPPGPGIFAPPPPPVVHRPKMPLKPVPGGGVVGAPILPSDGPPPDAPNVGKTAAITGFVSGAVGGAVAGYVTADHGGRTPTGDKFAAAVVGSLFGMITGLLVAMPVAALTGATPTKGTST